MPPAIISSYDTSRAEPRATTRAKTREALAELGLSCVKKSGRILAYQISTQK